MNEVFFPDPGSPIKRLRILLISRVAIVSCLLVISLFSEIKGAGIWPGKSFSFFYLIIFLVYILSLAYGVLFKFLDNVRVFVYLQNICDVLLITALVYVTGGAHSIYSVFYPLVIIYPVLFLGRNSGILIASGCSVLYGLMLGLELYGVIHPAGTFAGDYPLEPGYFYSRILTHVLSFYTTAFLARFVVEQEKKARVLLEEKENAFGQLDQLHRSIIESVDAGIITINLQGRVKSFNRAAGEITGYTSAEVENRNIGDIFPGFKPAPERINRSNGRSLTKRRVEITVPGKNDNNVLLGCSVSPLKDNKERHIGEIIIFRDMTAIKEMEDNLDKSRRLAFIGEMAASLAHEIRNPLASISGSIQVLQKGLDLNETDEKLMQIILRGKDQLEIFMKDFLFLARPHSNVYEKTDLKEVIDDAIESVRYGQDWNESIEVVWELLTPATTIEVNRAEIRQVMWNLLLNAVQSMPDGGRLTIAVSRMTLPGRDSDEYMEIRISDNGMGIDEKDLKKIFEPFYTTKERGTGLGLAVVSRIIEGHCGKIRMESRLTEGTTCIVWLPLTVHMNSEE